MSQRIGATSAASMLSWVRMARGWSSYELTVDLKRVVCAEIVRMSQTDSMSGSGHKQAPWTDSKSRCQWQLTAKWTFSTPPNIEDC
jgi:hypothetical protein